MRPLTILVDADDTIHYLCEGWVWYLNMKYGTRVDWQTIDQWNLEPFFPSLTSDEVEGALMDDGLWPCIQYIPEAAEYIRRLREDGHKVYLVTASDYHTIKAKMETCVFRNLPFLTWDDVVVTSHKELVMGDVIVDDGLHNLAVSPCNTKLLFHAPHNVSFNAEKAGYHRVFTWEEAYKVIEKLANS